MRRTTLFPLLAALLIPFAFTPLAAQDIVEKMEREHSGDEPVSNPLSEAEPALPVSGSEIVYAELDGAPVHGYLARPTEPGSDAAVLVIHEWWGLNDNVRAMADRLAGEGFTALAVDLYQGQVAENRENAANLMRGTLERRETLEHNIRQAHRYLTDESGASSVGVIGWCFGGGWSLRTALLMGDRISAAVIFYGRLVTEPSDLASLTAPVLGLFGELDGGIPVETVREFEAALDSLQKDVEIHVYPDADHAFANPSGTRYNPEAATDAWEKTTTFLRRHLQ